MATKEAKIILGVEGAGKASADVMKVGGSFVELADKLFGIVKIAKDATNAIANIKPVNFTESTNQVEAYRDKVTRLGVTFRQTEGQIEGLMAKFDAVGLRVGQSADSVADATETLAKAYDLKIAVSMVEDLGIRANNTSRSLRDMSRDAIALKDGLTIPSNQFANTFRLIDQQAEKYGTVGGGQALEKRIESMAPILKKYDSSTPEKRAKLIATVAAVGKDLPPDEATEAAHDALGSIVSQPQQISRYVGRDILKSGKIDPDALYDLSKKIQKSRNKDSALRTETALFGGNRQAANNFANITPSDVNLPHEFELGTQQQQRDAANLYLSQDNSAQIEDLGQEDLYAKTKAGKLNQAYLERDAVHLKVGTKMLAGRDEYQEGYRGHREAQAAAETVGGYVGGAIQAGGAIRASAKAALAPTKAPVTGDQAWYLAGRRAQVAANAAPSKPPSKPPSGKPKGKTGSSGGAHAELLKEQNQILRGLPAKIGEQLRSDPNQASVDKARAKPSN